MNRNRTIVLAVFALMGGMLLSGATRPASAERPFNLRSLHGTYIGGLVEVRLPPIGTTPMEYCDTEGTLIFDGAGGGFSHITRRCNYEGTVTDVLTFTYSVSADGNADILFSSGARGHFRLAQGGALAFKTAVGDPDANVLVHNGVFARQ
jgi:hypothetical protein